MPAQRKKTARDRAYESGNKASIAFYEECARRQREYDIACELIKETQNEEILWNATFNPRESVREVLARQKLLSPRIVEKLLSDTRKIKIELANNKEISAFHISKLLEDENIEVRMYAHNRVHGKISLLYPEISWTAIEFTPDRDYTGECMEQAHRGLLHIKKHSWDGDCGEKSRYYFYMATKYVANVSIDFDSQDLLYLGSASDASEVEAFAIFEKIKVDYPDMIHDFT